MFHHWEHSHRNCISDDKLNKLGRNPSARQTANPIPDDYTTTPLNRYMAWPKPWHKKNLHGLVNIHTITHLFTLALTNSTCLHCFTPSLLQETFHHSPSLITALSCSLSIYKLNHAVRDTGILTTAYSMMISLTPKWINSGQNGWERKTTSITHWNGGTKRSSILKM